MNTVNFIIPKSDIREVVDLIKGSGVKFYPIRRQANGYRLEIKKDPVAMILALKYGVF